MSRGSASVLAIGVVGVSAILLTSTAAVGHAFAIRVALDGAADAAALAAADALAGFVAQEACAVAGTAASLNGVRLSSCAIDGAVAEVTVATEILGMSIASRARAGPPS